MRGSMHPLLALITATVTVGSANTPASAKGETKAETALAEAYEASYGIWTMLCDPCMSYEDPVCMIWAKPDESGVWVYPIDESDPKSPLAMSYLPARLLNFGTEGTLSITVDDTKLREIVPPDVTYSEMYGDLFVEPGPTAGLLPALRDGPVLTLEYTDAAGGEPDSFTLDGFAAALADFEAHWPFPRHPFDYVGPGACAY